MLLYFFQCHQVEALHDWSASSTFHPLLSLLRQVRSECPERSSRKYLVRTNCCVTLNWAGPSAVYRRPWVTSSYLFWTAAVCDCCFPPDGVNILKKGQGPNKIITSPTMTSTISVVLCYYITTTSRLQLSVFLSVSLSVFVSSVCLSLFSLSFSLPAIQMIRSAASQRLPFKPLIPR